MITLKYNLFITFIRQLIEPDFCPQKTSILFFHTSNVLNFIQVCSNFYLMHPIFSPSVMPNYYL